MDKEGKREKANTNSPDTVLEDFLRYAESQTDSSESLLHIDPKPASSRLSGFLHLFGFKSKQQNALKLSKIYSSSLREPNAFFDPNLNYFKPQWKSFSLLQLQTATSNFCQDYLNGKGGYAEVYRGRLHGGQLVAIKRLTKGGMEERIADFLTELGIMGHVNHPKLIGYGVEGGVYLVLELSPIGSLASMLHNPSSGVVVIRWHWERLRGCCTSTRRIIHRDIKAANIMLTEDFEPQICDFGLAKWLPDRWTHLTISKCEATFGYS